MTKLKLSIYRITFNMKISCNC